MRPDEWITDLLSSLAGPRPVFHSEADFQLALAWQAQLTRPHAKVRLETRPMPGMHLDMLLVDPDGPTIAVELKYLTAAWSGEHAGEPFLLLNHGAQDIRAYDCVKDIQRVESFVAAGIATHGVAVILSNDASYWRAPGHGRETNAAAFRLYEGTVLEGTRAWGPATGVGTMKNRTDPIALGGRYRCHWRDYSRMSGRTGSFRYATFACARAAATQAP